ncbi:hypothetical protein HYALB_00013932 [Hymenoscyphus albidus]|uniref:Uncharacterized protein n=1 Tax=Hymenoscyphus albidus TaxID=595503 RepID=A0A9N9M014_9HELO|nr:hypothetical protein HYALB_00013932 [Hymenoscyphus albidus]
MEVGNTLANTVAIVAMESNAKLCEMIQYLARPHRLGQMNHQVHCYVTYSEGTIEEKQMERNKSNLHVAAFTDAMGMSPVVISSDESDGSDKG